MKNLFVHWFVTAIAVILASYLLSGVSVSSFVTALLVALVLGAINTIVRPLLIIMTLPINILSLGLLTFFINALLVWFTAMIVPGFQINGFWWALLFSLVLSVVSYLLHKLTEKIA